MTGRRTGGEADRSSGNDLTARPPNRPTDLPDTGRLLAVDPGAKRIGLALSDPSQTIAQPLGTLTRRTGRRFPLKQLKRFLDEHQPVGILVGLPLESDGSEGDSAIKAHAIGELMQEKTGLPVAFMDERMTTARALRAIRELGGGLRGRRGDVDPLAATTLLQTYLDGRTR
jgi:putative Holliday junction resolvase